MKQSKSEDESNLVIDEEKTEEVEQKRIKEDKDKEDKEETLSILNSNKVRTWNDYEKIIIKNALDKYKSFNAAGKALGLSHKTVAAKARKYGIE